MLLARSCFVMAAGLLLTAATVRAADQDQLLKQAAGKLGAMFSENQIRETGERLTLFKQAGLSYQPSLAVPVEEIVGCKDNQQLRVLMGLYLFDANYALLFGKKQAFAAAYQQINDIADRLSLKSKLRFRTFTPDELAKVLDNPDDPANRELYVKYIAANVYDMLMASAGDRENLGLGLDVGYGTIVQGLYASGKLALAAGTGEKLMAVFNEQAARVERFNGGLAAFAGSPELEALTQRSQRQRVLNPVAEILKTRQGNLEEADVRKILSVVEPERGRMVRKCD